MNSSAGDMCVRMCKAVALREAFEPRASFEPRMPPRASDPQRLLQFYHHLRGCCRQHAFGHLQIALCQDLAVLRAVVM
jgi:hypothetical protein